MITIKIRDSEFSYDVKALALAFFSGGAVRGRSGRSFRGGFGLSDHMLYQ